MIYRLFEVSASISVAFSHSFLKKYAIKRFRRSNSSIPFSKDDLNLVTSKMKNILLGENVQFDQKEALRALMAISDLESEYERSRDKEQFLQLAIKDKEEMVAKTEEMVAKTEEIIAAKDEAITKVDRIIAAKDEAIAAVKEQLNVIRAESLRSKGLLTSRGVFEFKLRLVYHETKLTKKFNVTEICNYLNKLLLLKSKSDVGTHTQDMINFAKLCKLTSFVEVYSELSNEIHGYSWDGMSVKALKENTSSNTLCLTKHIAKNFNLNVEYI